MTIVVVGRKASIITTVCLILWRISSHFYSSYIPESETIDIVIKPIPVSEEIKVKTSTFVNETENMTPWAFQWWRSPKYGERFWWIFASFVPILISVFICLMVCRHFRWFSLRKNEEKVNCPFRTLPHQIQLRATVEDLLKKMEERRAGIRHDRNRGKIMKEKDKRPANTNSELDIAVILKLKGKGRRRRFQKSKDKTSVVIEKVGGSPANSEKEMNSKKIMKDRSHSLFTEQRAGDSAYMELPARTRRCTRSSSAASKDKDEKYKARVGLAPRPNLKAATGKVLNWRNRIQRSDERLEKKKCNSKVDCKKVETKVQSKSDDKVADRNKVP
jgi:hypothetical protein